MMSDDWANEFLRYAAGKLKQHLRQVIRCARLLNQDEIWYRANPHANSVGNLILHLTGNVGQWILEGLGGEAFHRDRRAEFAQRGPLPAAAIVSDLERVVARAMEILSGLDAQALMTHRTIQGYEVSGLLAVFHVVEHFAGHTGQIVHITKLLRNIDLSLYDADGRKLPGHDPLP